jgi:hypothetical protein
MHGVSGLHFIGVTFQTLFYAASSVFYWYRPMNNTNNIIATHQIGPNKEIEENIEGSELSTSRKDGVFVEGDALIAFCAKKASSSKNKTRTKRKSQTTETTLGQPPTLYTSCNKASVNPRRSTPFHMARSGTAKPITTFYYEMWLIARRARRAKV